MALSLDSPGCLEAFPGLRDGWSEGAWLSEFPESGSHLLPLSHCCFRYPLVQHAMESPSFGLCSHHARPLQSSLLILHLTVRLLPLPPSDLLFAGSCQTVPVLCHDLVYCSASQAHQWCRRLWSCILVTQEVCQVGVASSLFTVSLTQGQLSSKHMKWKIPERQHSRKFYYSILLSLFCFIVNYCWSLTVFNL